MGKDIEAVGPFSVTTKIRGVDVKLNAYVACDNMTKPIVIATDALRPQRVAAIRTHHDELTITKDSTGRIPFIARNNEQHKTTALFDTGAGISLMSHSTYSKLGYTDDMLLEELRFCDSS